MLFDVANEPKKITKKLIDILETNTWRTLTLSLVKEWSKKEEM